MTKDGYKFENIYDKNLERIYEKGFFKDDLIVDVFRNEEYFYLKTSDDKLILFDDTNKIYKMKLYEEEKLADFDDLNDMQFESKNYIYKYKKGQDYLKVIKKGSE